MNDHSLFINSSKGSFTTLLVYVDDIILARNYKEDIGDLRYFLVLEVTRSKEWIMVNQRK